jgi:hypothetical protein
MRPGLVIFAIAHLLQNLLSEGMRNLSRVCRQPPGPDLAPRQQLVGADVLALVLGERVEEHGASAGPVGD